MFWNNNINFTSIKYLNLIYRVYFLNSLCLYQNEFLEVTTKEFKTVTQRLMGKQIACEMLAEDPITKVVVSYFIISFRMNFVLIRTSSP